MASSPLLGPSLQPCGGGLAGLGGRWLTPCVLPRLSPSAQTTSSETNEGALLVERTSSDFSQTLFFLPLLVGGATCGWLVLPLTLARPCLLHRHAASLCSSLTPTGLLSPVSGVAFAAVGSIMQWKRKYFFSQLELEGAKSSFPLLVTRLQGAVGPGLETRTIKTALTQIEPRCLAHG